ncbi:hypothetical protein LTR28_005056 [Elasticomyces elasticus]|nr:hypothetical protein LTR28_005056 [Elasticomyces elasticus]
MLPNHRPAPSKATLRFLRHLAYISSGTACGVAALLAEERRRQIGLVKKTAEKGGIVKNCTRRNHAAAALRILEEDQEFAIVNGLEDGGHWCNGGGGTKPEVTLLAGVPQSLPDTRDDNLLSRVEDQMYIGISGVFVRNSMQQTQKPKAKAQHVFH